MDQETRKGQPGSKATFPNGLKDVHDMAAAAEALTGMGGEDEGIKTAERKGEYPQFTLTKRQWPICLIHAVVPPVDRADVVNPNENEQSPFEVHHLAPAVHGHPPILML